MEEATCTTIHLAGREVTLALNARQLYAREQGDLITAEIVDVRSFDDRIAVP